MNLLFFLKMGMRIFVLLTCCSSFLFSGEISFKHSFIDDNGPDRPWAKMIGDIDGDGFQDVLIGGNKGPLIWYKYSDWSKTIITDGGYDTVDGELGDIDGDGDLDVIMGGILWYENPRPLGNPASDAWMEHRVAEHGTHDVELSDLDGDGDLDIVTRNQSSFGNKPGNEIHLWRQDPNGVWTNRKLLCPHGEGLKLADMDGDKDSDIVIGGAWYENPKDILEEEWIIHRFTDWHMDASVATADINGDGRVDIILSPAELKSNYYKLCWFRAPSNPKNGKWVEHIVQEKIECVIHGLQAADMDADGSIDIIYSEMHQGEDPDEVAVYFNEEAGRQWKKQLLSEKGSHLIQAADLGNDGDMDIVGANHAGDYQAVQVWENQSSTWTHLSSLTGKLPVPNVGRQVATLILDIDKDGLDDFIIASYEKMVWYKQEKSVWRKFALENGSPAVHMEAGGDFFDIDKDGDLDVVMAAQSKLGEVWWWENPYPDYFPGKPWKRHLVAEIGGTHHDQIFGDFDGDGLTELAFWYNRGKILYLAEIPSDPKQSWSYTEIAQFKDDLPSPEGLAKIDLDLDGKLDIIGGGYWFKHTGGTDFTPNVIDSEYRFSRTAVGDLIKGGRSEVLIGSGDQTGPLNMYEWKKGKWIKQTLIKFVDHGHTLRVGDLNLDGNLDIYTAEMYNPGPLDACRQLILYGDGKGKFKTVVLSTGLGTHEGRIGDLDGDGDLDILQKDFNQQRRVDIWLNPIK
jgi:hypothetical protein